MIIVVVILGCYLTFLSSELLSAESVRLWNPYGWQCSCIVTCIGILGGIDLVVTRTMLVHEIFEMLLYIWQIPFLWFYM